MNVVFYDNFQSRAIVKHRDFSTITVTVSKNDYSFQQWQELIEKVSTWTESDIYIIDFLADGDFPSQNIFSDNFRLHFIQSMVLDENFSPKAKVLPTGIFPRNTYRINYPDFSHGTIRAYQPINNADDDIIHSLLSRSRKKSAQEITINYMIGEGYLPAVDFDDVLAGRVDQRLFESRNVLIVNQANTTVPTPISQIQPVNNSQYYAYLFESVFQDIEIRAFPAWLQLLFISLLATLTWLIVNFLPSRLRTGLLIALTLLCVGLGYLILGFNRYKFPVFELIAVITLTNWLLNKQQRSNEQEQLIIGNRVYNQILENSIGSKSAITNHKLLESFSRFVCELLSTPNIAYEINTSKKTYFLDFDNDRLNDNTNIYQKYQTQENYVFELSLLNNNSCKVFFTVKKHASQAKKIESLLQNKEQFLKPILSHLAIEYDESSTGLWNIFALRLRSEHIHEKFKRTTDNFINHYFLLKSNFESLQTASILYGVNAEVIQTNQATEDFARENDIKIFNETLISSLTKITGLKVDVIRKNLLELVIDQESVIVWPTRKEGFDKNYLVTVSSYTNESALFGGYLVELVDIEEISYITRLKNNYVSELNNQLRNDFSEVMLAIDFVSMGIDDGPSLEDVSEKLASIAKKLHSSDMMLKTINEIMRKKQYPVDIRELVAQAVKATEDAVEEKQITLKLKQPRFINLVLVDYQHFAKICKMLLLSAIQDCMDEGELSITINELEQEQDRFVEIVITTKGYGIFDQNTLKHTNETISIGNNPFMQVEQYISSLGGRLSVVSNVGEGSTITTVIPCYRL